MTRLVPIRLLAHRGLVFSFGLLTACSQSPQPDDAPSQPPEIARVTTAAQALEGAHIPTLDPSTMNGAEIRKVVESSQHCTFRYTSTGKPVVIAGVDQNGSTVNGVVKLNGSIIALQPDSGAPGSGSGGFALAADPVHLRVQSDPQAAASAKSGQGQVAAEMVFEIGQQLKVGYSGYLDCRAARAAPASTAR